MAKRRETDTIKGPPQFATAAINGDVSGFEDRDQRNYGHWFAYNVPEGWDIVDVGDEPEFSSDCRAWGLPWSGGELVEYTIMKME
jgi:hypothetical protein